MKDNVSRGDERAVRRRIEKKNSDGSRRMLLCVREVPPTEKLWLGSKILDSLFTAWDDRLTGC